MESSHFWPSVLHDSLYKTLFFDFWFRPPNAQNLLPKICTKSPISRLVWQIDGRCLGLPTGFREWLIQRNYAKCCRPTCCCHGNEIWARRGDPVAYRLVCLSVCLYIGVQMIVYQCSVTVVKPLWQSPTRTLRTQAATLSNWSMSTALNKCIPRSLSKVCLFLCFIRGRSRLVPDHFGTTRNAMSCSGPLPVPFRYHQFGTNWTTSVPSHRS